MVIFNILMFISILLMMFALIGIQAYFISSIFKDFIKDKDCVYLICLIGIISTSFATIGLLVGMTSMLFTGGGLSWG